jgi:hypothetical protein
MAGSIILFPRFPRAILVALACVFLSVTASADTLVVSTSPTDSESTYLMENGVDTYTYAGEADITLDGNINRTAYCVAIFTDINPGTVYNTTLEDISAVNNGLRVGWLLDYESPLIGTSGNGLAGTADQQGAGLQLAIWDIVNDNGDGLSKGNIQAATTSNTSTGNYTDAVAVTDAGIFEAASIGKSADAWVYYNTNQTTGAVAQTLMGYVTFTDGGPTVPEPGTFGVVTLGLVIAGIALRRKHSPARPV